MLISAENFWYANFMHKSRPMPPGSPETIKIFAIFFFNLELILYQQMIGLLVALSSL